MTRAKDPSAVDCVLIVDDVDSNVQHLELILRMAGASSVHTVTDARSAVDRCLEVLPDVVLMDLDMPHVDGHEVLDSLRRVLPDEGFLPVLVLTSDTTTQARERALDAGVNDFLTKPYDDVEFVQRVRNLLTMRALYRTVQRHNLELQAELDAHAEGHRRVTVERDLRRARVADVIADGALRMVYQPIVDLAGGQTVGVEALGTIRLRSSTFAGGVVRGGRRGRLGHRARSRCDRSVARGAGLAARGCVPLAQRVAGDRDQRPPPRVPTRSPQQTGSSSS